jgi:hypothetical protein
MKDSAGNFYLRATGYVDQNDHTNKSIILTLMVFLKNVPNNINP